MNEAFVFIVMLMMTNVCYLIISSIELVRTPRGSPAVRYNFK